ncbi:hypothetical protein SKAU_G00147340 [Synaphobranchus kaupii]|uniref:Uncharacterized protein n=1 Tax=Synaphobranchus kaupii TaxID=118154 RepID=A0A9Q1FUI8_SYNKA|nr:hypothetical protein SKAU_G00147340 [Synaphobranchus kaupii]
MGTQTRRPAGINPCSAHHLFPCVIMAYPDHFTVCAFHNPHLHNQTATGNLRETQRTPHAPWVPPRDSIPQCSGGESSSLAAAQATLLINSQSPREVRDSSLHFHDWPEQDVPSAPNCSRGSCLHFSPSGLGCVPQTEPRY